MKLVGYARVSTERQKEEGTIEIQERELRIFTQEKGHKLVALFKDDGVSGGLELRPGMSELVDYLDKNPGAVDGVLIFKLDRLARDLMIQEHFIKDFQTRGLRVLSTKEPDLDSKDPTRVFIRQVLGATSQYEKAMIAMRLQGGRMRKARRGGYSGGGRALGYKRDVELDSLGRVTQKDIRIDEDAAATVQRIFDLSAQGESLNGIARTLNRENVPTARGGKWYARTVKYILENPVYTGRLSYSGETADRADLALVNA